MESRDFSGGGGQGDLFSSLVESFKSYYTTSKLGLSDYLNSIHYYDSLKQETAGLFQL